VDRHRRLVAERPVPHLLQQLLAAERRARPLQQEGEQVELAGGQREQPATEARLVRGQVDDQVAVADDPGGVRAQGRTAAAQDRVDAEHQLARAERLAHVVVSAELQAGDPVRLVVA
jgi:hypothetical protein